MTATRSLIKQDTAAHNANVVQPLAGSRSWLCSKHPPRTELLHRELGQAGEGTRLRAVGGVLRAAPAVPVREVQREVARREAVVHVVVPHGVQRRARLVPAWALAASRCAPLPAGFGARAGRRGTVAAAVAPLRARNPQAPLALAAALPARLHVGFHARAWRGTPAAAAATLALPVRASPAGTRLPAGHMRRGVMAALSTDGVQAARRAGVQQRRGGGQRRDEGRDFVPGMPACAHRVTKFSTWQGAADKQDM